MRTRIAKTAVCLAVIMCIIWALSEILLHEKENEQTCVEIPSIVTQELAKIEAEEVNSEKELIDSVEGKQQNITVEATAYCPCVKCCGKSDGITASGVKAVEGITIAADTKVFPMGTKIDIDGHIYTVQDTGGAIKGNRIDIYFNSHAEALKFGRKIINVHVIDEMEEI